MSTTISHALRAGPRATARVSTADGPRAIGRASALPRGRTAVGPSALTFRRALGDAPGSSIALAGSTETPPRAARAPAGRRRDASRVVAAAASGAPAPPPPGKMRVAVSGASGFVGTRLVAKLLAANHDVIILTRDVAKARAALRNSFSGGTITFVDPSQWAAAIPGCTGVVNLAGEPISTRWSPAIKAEIMASRIKATKRIADAIEACPADLRPAALVNASAVGFYGTSETRVFDESAPAGTDYLSKVCQAWESTAAEIEKAGVRVVLLRLGIVLDRDGGALGKMLPTFQIFAGGPMGDGAQWFSWVHREDAVGIIMESLTNEAMRGPVNVTAPNPVRMGEMCAALGRTLGRPSWLPVPDFAIQALLGEGATVVLQGQKVTPNAAVAAGYKFKYERLDDALQNILR